MLPSVVLVMSLLAFGGLSDGLSVQKVNSTELVKPRTIEKPLSFLLNLIKVYKALKPKANPETFKKVAQVKPEIVPFDGLSFHEYFNRRVGNNEHFPTLDEIMKQDQIMNDGSMKDKDEKTKDDPYQAMIKKFLKDKKVLLGIKIALKVIIFKAIVKFIGLISLLFFLPTLNYEEPDKDSSEETRSFPYGESK